MYRNREQFITIIMKLQVKILQNLKFRALNPAKKTAHKDGLSLILQVSPAHAPELPVLSSPAAVPVWSPLPVEVESVWAPRSVAEELG